MKERLGRLLRAVIVFARRHRTGLGYAISGAGLAALGLYLYLNWQVLAGAELSFDAPRLAASLLLMTLVGAVPPLLWARIMRDALGIELGWRAGYWIWTVSQVSRYLPGGVWNYLSRVVLCSREGIPAVRTTLSLYLEIVLILVAQIGAFVLTLPFWPQQVAPLYWTLLIIPLGLSAVHPAVLGRVLGWLARVRGEREPVPLRLSTGWLLDTLPGYLGAALVGGAAFYLLVSSIYRVPLALLPVLAGVVNISTTVGFLVLIAPSGLGVREGVLAFLLSLYLAAPVAVTIALASRVWLAVAELLGLGIALLLKPELRREADRGAKVVD
jgi:hypothetical protein